MIGFEVKVTEALHKAVPVVAYRAGGIALQIKHGQSGYLCEIGDMKAVVDHLSELLSNERLWSEMSQCACLSVTEDYWTVNGAVNWLWLFNDFIQKDVHAPEGSEYVSIDSGFRWAQQEWKSFGKK